MNTRSNTIAPVVPASEVDPVVKIGRLLGSSRLSEIDLEERSSQAHADERLSAKLYLETAEKHAFDRTEALSEMLAVEKATTLEGAMIQIAAAILRLDMLWDQVPKEAESRLMVRDYRAADRLLHSALDVVQGLSASKLDDLVYTDFGSPRSNPWVPVEERCPQLQEAAK